VVVPSAFRCPGGWSLQGPILTFHLSPAPTEAILAVVVIAIYCYIGLAWALCYIRLAVVRGMGTIRKRSAFA
jgi:hypothetical protein